MTSEGLEEMFEGDSADLCAGKFPLVSMGGRSDGLACADPGVRSHIGASGIPNRNYFLYGNHFPAGKHFSPGKCLSNVISFLFRNRFSCCTTAFYLQAIEFLTYCSERSACDQRSNLGRPLF